MEITVWACTDKIRSEMTRTIEIEDGDLEDLSEQERDNLIYERAEEEVQNMIEWGWR